jgi:hypothetical protein
MFGGLLNDLIAQAYRRVAATGWPLDPPLLVVIDEAGTTPLRALPAYASTLAGIGVLFVTIWQSLAQIEASYGRDADTILTNYLTKVFYAGVRPRVAALCRPSPRRRRSRNPLPVPTGSTRPGLYPALHHPHRARPRPRATPDAARRRPARARHLPPRTSAPTPTTATAASPTARPSHPPPPLPAVRHPHAITRSRRRSPAASSCTS